MKLPIYLIVFFFVVQPVVRDDYNRDLSLSSMPQRIVSIAPSITELVFAIGAGEKLVGVDSESNFPEQARSIEKVGTYISPSLEMIIALKPDLLLVSDLTPQQVIDTIENRGIKVFAVAPKSIDGVAESMRKLGIVLGTDDEAERAAESFEQRVSAVERKTALAKEKPRVYLEYFPYWTFGPGSFGNDLITRAGGINIGKRLKSPYAEVSDEFVVSENPDVIIITEGKHSTTTISSVRERQGWKDIDAVKSNRVYYIDDDLVSRPGPRTADALEELYSILH
jgi:iron complex transport system substrate-binding protein